VITLSNGIHFSQFLRRGKVKQIFNKIVTKLWQYFSPHLNTGPILPLKN